MRHRKWWRVRARPIVANALLPHLSIHESKVAAERVLDALEEKGLRIVRDHAAPAPISYKVIGTGLFRLPGERRAREMLNSVEQDREDG